jgi:hypothetical protein
MGNFFEEVLDNVTEVEEELLGPDYKYYDQIKSPTELGMSTKGNISTISKDITGLIDYVEVLVTGTSKASKTGKPLGDKFFLKTGGTCSDIDTGNKVDRYIYINNVPDGSIPFISSAMGSNFSTFEGLIPGTLSNLSDMNPFEIFQAFLIGSDPSCQEISLETIDVNNNRKTESQYVATVDIQNMSACDFSDKKNPVTGKKCSEGFTNINQTKDKNTIDKSKLPNDKLVQIFYASMGILGLYILFRLLQKSKMK